MGDDHHGWPLRLVHALEANLVELSSSQPLPLPGWVLQDYGKVSAMDSLKVPPVAGAVSEGPHLPRCPALQAVLPPPKTKRGQDLLRVV